MKSTCFHCHKLRVMDAKLTDLTIAFKLLKAGEIIGSQKIRGHFANLASQVLKVNDDPKFI